MANVNDYLEWRGDIPFTCMPFNEVDSLVLSILSYTDFSDIVPGPESASKVTLKYAFEKFFEKNKKEDILAKKTETKYAPFLMEKMVDSARFGDMYLFGYTEIFDKELDTQFSCISFLLNDDTYFIAYRGTDSTIVGWKEDLNMGYLYQTPGQLNAKNYLDQNYFNSDKMIRVGGHSKGGNFAVYAAAFCDESIQDKIINVYSNDGPGFRREVCMKKGYKRIVSKVISTVPEESVVGMLLENDYEDHVIKSSKKGMSQHDGYSWQVLGSSFVESELTESSIKIDKALSDWIDSMTITERKLFIDSIFEPLEKSEFDTIDDLFSGNLFTIMKTISSYQNFTDEQKELLKEPLKKLLSNIYDNFLPVKNHMNSLANKKASIEASFAKKKAEFEEERANKKLKYAKDVAFLDSTEN